MYPPYRLVTPLAMDISFRSFPLTLFTKVASSEHHLSIQPPLKQKVTINITLEICFRSHY